ncbi:hypothetical protein CWO33_01360 [Vibrio splendidus]|uniref:hypothetical protein n=1 Tax=Vibrio splendidus TaxID=29497 RepID=UPI000D3813C7|nr:hypothetical protein [Vibrio splendidus]PTQ18204.1 hypothetical protein CWO33_01360 [Vibrio splendidus]
MNNIKAKEAAEKRINTMITPQKVKGWEKRIAERLNPKFDGSLNVNILPVSEDPKSEVITDICRQASGVATGLYLEDLIPLCNQEFQRSPSNSGHDLNIPEKVGVDVKMSTETVKKGDKKKVSSSLKDKCHQFEECFWVEFFGAPKSEDIDGVMWYSGSDAHRELGLSEANVNWISEKVDEFRKISFQEIKKSLV